MGDLANLLASMMTSFNSISFSKESFIAGVKTYTILCKEHKESFGTM